MKNLYKILVVSALVFSLFAVKVSFAAEPTVMVDTASNITNSSATFSAFYNANGETITGAMFKYGTDPLMSQTAYVTTPTAASGTIATTVTGLLPNTTYYFKGVIVSTYGLTTGYSAPFTTLNTVTPPPASCTITMSASPTSITVGSSSTLSWTTTNCNGATLTYPGNSVNVSGTGTYTVTPTATTTYTISSQNSNGTLTSQTVTVTVGSTPPPSGTCAVTLSASQTSVYTGTPVTLSWTAVGCTYVNFGSGSYTQFTGSTVVNVTTSSTYTFYGYGTNNNDSKTVTVAVIQNGGGNCGVTGCPCIYSCTQPCTYNSCPPYTTNPVYQYPVNNRGYYYSYPTVNYATYQSPVQNYLPVNNNVGNTSGNTYVSTPAGNSSTTTRNTTTTNTTTRNTKGVYDTAQGVQYMTVDPNQVQYVDPNMMNANGNNLAAGAAFGGGSFLPGTLIGWLILILFIFLVVFLARKLFGIGSNNAHGHTH